MFKNEYNEDMDKINVSEDLINDTINRALLENEKPKHSNFRKIAPATVFLLIIVIFPVLIYAKIIDLELLISKFFDDNDNYIAQFETKLDGLYGTYDGMKIELLSTTKDYDTLYLLLSVTDMVSDRLSEKSSFSFDFSDEGIWYWDDKVFKYDKDTKTVYFVIIAKGIDVNNTKNIELKPKFIHNEYVYNYGKLDLYKALKNHNYTIYFEKDAYDVTIQNEATMDIKIQEGRNLLNKDELNIEFVNSDDYKVNISNIGIVDGFIQFQIFLKEPEFQDENYITIVDENDKIISDKIEFLYDDTVEMHGEYFVYRNYKLNDFKTLDELKGLYLKNELKDHKKEAIFIDARFAFDVPKEIQNIEIPIDRELKIGDMSVNNGKIVVSPIGIKIYFENELTNKFNKIEEIYIKYDDGTKVKLEYDEYNYATDEGFDYHSTQNNERVAIDISFGRKIIKLDGIKSIIIGGTEIKLN